MATSPAPREVNVFERIVGCLARWFTGHGATAWSFVASFLLAASTVLQAIGWPTAAWVPVAVTGLSALVISALLALTLKPSYLQLRREHQDLDEMCVRLRKSQTTMLGYMAKRALIDIFDGDEDALKAARISVYVEQHGRFVLLGRWAKNEKFRRVGRLSIPSDKGLIGIAWGNQRGVATVNTLPADREAWVSDQHTRHGLDEATARNLTMQSRSIGAVRIDGSRKSGIFVIESERSRALTLAEMENLKENALLIDINHAISDENVINPRLGTEVADVPGLQS